MNYQFFALTDMGRVRSNNEDAVVVDDVQHVAVLADGMGGYNAGEVASGMASTYMAAELSRWLASGTHSAKTEQIARAIEICAKKANQSILNAAAANPQYTGMSTTLVVGVFLGEHLTLGHVGDSRCYRLRDKVLSQITKDHSMLQEQVDAGMLTPEQAAVAPGKNLLTRALGAEDALLIDVAVHEVKEGDLYLMCSDGLTDMVNDTSLAEVMTSDCPLSQMAQALVNAANTQGGRDNIAVLLTKALHPQTRPGLMSALFGRP